jgi:hypothetical protein
MAAAKKIRQNGGAAAKFAKTALTSGNEMVDEVLSAGSDGG